MNGACGPLAGRGAIPPEARTGNTSSAMTAPELAREVLGNRGAGAAGELPEELELLPTAKLERRTLASLLQYQTDGLPGNKNAPTRPHKPLCFGI